MPEQTLKAPTDEFMRAVCNGGSPVTQCELCGRLNFVGHARPEDDYPESEVQDYIAKAEDFPDKYHAHDDSDYISHGAFDGKELVWGCPCNLASRYEQFLWAHRHVIADYFQNVAARLQGQRNEAKRTETSTRHAIDEGQ